MSYDPASEAPQDGAEVRREDATEVQERPSWRQWLRFGARTVARVWVLGFLAAAAVASGMSIAAVSQAQRELELLKREPSVDAYAILAYRQELERQLEAYRRGEVTDVTPKPPVRPRLMEEIDIARARNAATLEERRAAEAARVAPRATGPAAPVVRAPN